MTDTVVADTIALQLAGGVRKIRLMLGAKSVVAGPDSLTVAWPNRTRSKGNIVRITLRGDDTYNMEFFNGAKSVKRHEGLYAEDLRRTFENQTGWYLGF